MTYDRVRKHVITQYSVRLGRGALRAVARRVMGSITHVVTTEPIAALTFDDGPHPDYTPRLLEILERHQARGTFFMLGEVARQYPKLLQRMAQAELLGPDKIDTAGYLHGYLQYVLRMRFTFGTSIQVSKMS